MTQSYNLSHNKWLANLFKSGLPSPELPTNFPRAIRQMLMSPFPTLLSPMLELSAWSVNLGKVSVELMHLLSLCQVHCLQLVHKCLSRAVVQMANPGLDPVCTSKFHVANMLQQSRLLTNADTPPCTPHPVPCLINFRVRATGSQIGDNMALDRSDPDHVNSVADQLQTLVDHRLINDQGREVEVFNSMGNVHLELLVESVGVGVVIGSGEPSPESSANGSDQGETFTFGNNGLD